MEDDIYVVVAENDQPLSIGEDGARFYDPGGSLVFEQYVKDASLEQAKERASKMESKYGKCRIAKLVFV